MSRRIWVPIVVVVVALIAAGVPGAMVLRNHRQERAERAAVTAFARSWRTGRLADVGYTNGSGASVAAAAQKVTRGLTNAVHDSPTSVAVLSQTEAQNLLTARLRVGWTLPGGQTWSYPTSVRFHRVSGQWLVEYQPSLIQPDLVAGAVLRTVSKQPTRAQIIGTNNDVLVTDRSVVLVGLEPSRTDDIASSAARIAAITGIDGPALAKRAEAAGKNDFVQAISLRTAAFAQVRDRLEPIPGAIFQHTTLSLGPTPVFARALIGSIGPATADAVKASGGRVRDGDITGLSGLQEAYDKQLSGTSGITVEEATPAATTAPRTLFSVAPVPGTPLHLTLDRKIQTAADTALDAATKPAAIVAIQVGTGNVLAVANGGPNAAGYNRALLGRYPPGSTFKIATTLGLLGTGLTPTTPVNCPATITVGGRKFKNFEHEKFGVVPFRTDFANSCNTAFISEAGKISQSALARAAHALGYGQPNALGVTAFTGQVPTGGDSVAHAAAMIGQSTVLASPVTVAGTAAAVAAGQWNAPRLVLDGTPAPAAVPIPKAADADLKLLMRSVVTGGTGTILKSTPGGPVYGKTGTAEFGNDNPPQTHAWFTGYQGNVAFACIVEDGGFGATAAAPLIKSFLTQLAP